MKLSCKYIFLFALAAVLTPAVKTVAQAPPVLWQKTIGGSDDDVLSGVQALSGGGVMLSGFSKSGASGDKKDTSRGGYDYWLVKLDETGRVAWEKTFGGAFDDTAAQIIKTADGGYLLGGTSLSPRSGDKLFSNWGFSPDYWALKLDKNGEQLWQRNLGGNFSEKLTGLSENSYGYAVSGHSYSDISGDKVTDNTGSENRADYWIAFLDNTGKTKKTLTYGTVGPELSCCIVATDFGMIIGGSSYSRSQPGQKTRDPYGGADYWLVRTDLSGTKIYDSTMGGTQSDFMTCLIGAHSGGFIVGGYSESPVSGIKTDSCRGEYDYWIIKMNVDGSIKWQKTLGGAGGDYMTSIHETYDGGFIAGGYSNSDAGGEKSENSKGGYDYWIVKLDSLGNKQWDKTFGGSGDDKLVSVSEYAEGEYILCGTSSSPASGDKDAGTIGGTGKNDYWIIRLGKSVDTTTTPPVDTSAKGSYVLNILSNPAVGNNLNIQFSSTDNETTPFIVHSYDGKKVISVSYDATVNMQNKTIAIAKLPKGVYYITMYTKHKKMTKMFIKQ